MLTVAEFRAAADRYGRRSVIGALAIVFAAPVLSWGPVCLYGLLAAPPGVAPAEVMPGWSVAASGVAFLVFLFGGLIGFGWWVKRSAGPTCPHCGGSLEWAAVVIASRCCPGCGRRVLAEPPAPGDTAEPLPDLAVGAEREEALQQRLMWPIALGFLGPLVAGVPIALFRDSLRDWLRPVADRETVANVLCAAMVVPALAAGVWMCLVGARADRAAGQCPHCRTPFRRQVRLASLAGNCGRCGGRVSALPPDEPAGPLLSVEDIVTPGRAANRAAGRRLGIGAAATVVLMAGLGVLLAGGREERFLAEMERWHGVYDAAVIEAIGISVLALLVLTPLFGGVWAAVRVAPPGQVGARCPACGEPVGGTGWVVATKRCAKCRRRVIADPDGPVG